MATIKDLKSKSKMEKQDFINTDLLPKIENTESVKLSETEIRLVTELNRKKDLVAREVGFLAQQRLNLEYRQAEAEKLYRDNLDLERQLGNQFTEKYGNGTIDIEKGVFIPS